MARSEQLTIHSDPGDLAQVRTAVEVGGGRVGFSQKDCHAMALAVDEALANVIRHAYQGANDKKIEIEITELNQQDDRQGLKVCIRDYGKTVDLSKIKGRDLEDVRPGGLGVHIMRKIMDEVVFKCPSDGGTRLLMVKYLNNQQKEQ